MDIDTQSREETQKKALATLIQGVLIAQKNGVYTFKESELLSQAINVFTNDYQTSRISFGNS